ncbi:DUF2840 domain-containing protein [Phenylobacterium aquaticum]|uniref:DUF2840 domain-containing protein n=1 Tax=Phenylobacterium aquaticum TaxID=1763816 RepID=UPI001F5CE491|nr:DUF2840 domain-containing protein [Phenylobacterium aquaticum]MCI3132863.1 DUF2840 domain-containing protein [Phenylobacterium aquaticum]
MSPSAVRSGGADAVTADAPDPRTWVELVWIEGRIERWIRFGSAAGEVILDRRRRRVAFAPHAVFAFVRWAANEAGTVQSRIDILQAVALGAAVTTVPGVTPGGLSLLRLGTWPTVQAALHCVDAVEALGLDPVEIAPDYWRHVHNRLAARATPRPYSLARHRAWRLRRELGGC